MNEILNILAGDARRKPAEIAVMLGIEESAVEDAISKLEAAKVIVGFKSVIDWEKAGGRLTRAIIELKVTPEKGRGFDEVAEQISGFPQVKSLYLMSGSYDLGLIVEDLSMKDIALFVAERLAPMESIIATATHFVLKTYKEDGIMLDKSAKDPREVITL